MPREQITIENFSAGIVTTVDAQDTPINAASWSVDQDPEVPQGILRGREGDDAYIDANVDHSADTFSWIVREDGKRDFIFYSKTSGKFCSIVDFYSAKTYASQASLTTEMQTSIETFNRSVRLGQGNNEPKYLGYIDHGQYGAGAPSGLQYLNSKLSKFSYLPKFYKTVGDTTYGYGIEFQGTKVFKVTLATGELVSSSDSFGSLQGITYYDDTTDYIYVYDAGAGVFGTLYKLNTSLSIVEVYFCTGFGSAGVEYASAQSGIITDIEFNADQSAIFFAGRRSDNAAWNYSSGAGTSGSIFSIAKASLSANSAFVPTNRTPSQSAVSAAANVTGAFSNATVATTSWLSPKACLVRLWNGTEIGILAKFSSTTEVWWDSPVTVSTLVNMAIIVMNTSFTASNNLYDTNCNLVILGNSSVTIDSAVLMTGGGATPPDSSDVFLATYGTSIGAWLAKYDAPGVVKKRIGLHATYSADLLWDPTGTGVKSLANTSNETLKDSSELASLKYSSYATKYEFHVFNYKDLTVPFFYKYDCTATATFAGSTQTAVKRSEAYLTLEEVALPVTDAGFSITKKYFYQIAPIYDYFQQAPLQKDTAPDSIVVASANSSIKVSIYFQDSAVNTRVTGIAIYRAEADGVDSVKPTSYYKLVDTIDLVLGLSGSSTSAYGNFKYQQIFDIGLYGPSYESETGISEKLPNNFMRYSIATQGNGFLFTGQCFNEAFGTNSIANTIFRSKRNAPDTFDWSNDFLVLPVRPLALHFFRNQLFAFDQNTVYVIDPENFSLIAKYDGYGVTEPSNVVSNNEFMVFANANNIYLHDGQNISIISRAINISQYSSVGGLTVVTHRGLMASYHLSIAFNGKKNSIVFSYTKASSASLMFIFHIPSKSWYYWEIVYTGTYVATAGTGKKTIFSDYLGSVYLSTLKGVIVISSGMTPKTETLGGGYGSGTITLTINGVAYSQTNSGGVTATAMVTAFYNQHAATLFALGIVMTNPSAALLSFTSMVGLVTIVETAAGDGAWSAGTSALSEARKTCTWISRQFNNGDVTVQKKFIRIILNLPYAGTLASKYYSLNANTTISTAFTSGSNLSDSTTKANSIWLKILVTATEQLQGITIIFRRMFGIR